MPDLTVPSHLSTSSRSWLQGLLEEYDFTLSEWRLALLAAEAFDRAQTARRQLGREGLTIESPRGDLKPHPATVIARDSAALYSKLVAQLGLDDEPEEEPTGPVRRDSLGRKVGGR
jgi:P27 family predicted phage terminase small subunit